MATDNSTQTIIDSAKKILGIDCEQALAKFGKFNEIKRNGLFINEIVRWNIDQPHLMSFVRKVVDIDMRDPELIKLYIQLVILYISKVRFCTETYIINQIKKKVKNFSNWSIVTIFDDDTTDGNCELMESGVYLVRIELDNSRVGYEQYLCNGPEPDDNRIDYYILKNVSRAYQNYEIESILIKDLTLTGSDSQLDILPKTFMVQNNYACYRGCLMYLIECNTDMISDVLNICADKSIYWYHCGYMIRCAKDNQFNMFQVNEMLESILTQRRIPF